MKGAVGEDALPILLGITIKVWLSCKTGVLRRDEERYGRSLDEERRGLVEVLLRILQANSLQITSNEESLPGASLSGDYYMYSSQ